MKGFVYTSENFASHHQDELAVPLETTKHHLQADFVVGAFIDDALVGIGGLSRQTGGKINHRGLLWGMYVKPAYRGSGISNAIMQKLIDHAEIIGIEQIILTVVSENLTASRFYERWGFNVYGIDKSSIKLADGSSLDETLMVRCVPSA